MTPSQNKPESAGYLHSKGFSPNNGPSRLNVLTNPKEIGSLCGKEPHPAGAQNHGNNDTLLLARAQQSTPSCLRNGRQPNPLKYDVNTPTHISFPPPISTTVRHPFLDYSVADPRSGGNGYDVCERLAQAFFGMVINKEA